LGVAKIKENSYVQEKRTQVLPLDFWLKWIEVWIKMQGKEKCRFHMVIVPSSLVANACTTRDVSHCGLAIYIKSILRQKKNYENSNISS
jgi:hypothetical protein